MGATGVIAGTVIASIVFICSAMIVDSGRLLRRQAREAGQPAYVQTAVGTSGPGP